MQAPFDTWREFWQPHLVGSQLVATVALLVLSTPAEATPSERTFSVAGTTSKRKGGAKLKRSTLSHLTLLKRVIRDRLKGRKRLERAKRPKKSATAPGVFSVFAPPSTSVVAPPPLAVAAAPPSTSAATIPPMDELTEDFEARMEEESQTIEALIVSGDLAFEIGDQGELSLLEQHELDGLTGLDVETEEGQVVDNDLLTFDNFLLAYSRGGVSNDAVEIDANTTEVP